MQDKLVSKIEDLNRKKEYLPSSKRLEMDYDDYLSDLKNAKKDAISKYRVFLENEIAVHMNSLNKLVKKEYMEKNDEFVFSTTYNRDSILEKLEQELIQLYKKIVKGEYNE